jgi:hypothetical protein
MGGVQEAQLVVDTVRAVAVQVCESAKRADTAIFEHNVGRRREPHKPWQFSPGSHHISMFYYNVVASNAQPHEERKRHLRIVSDARNHADACGYARR